jgi:hypothetical protein
MAWKLVNCEARECTMDNSGHYTVINYIAGGLVRVDIMKTDVEPAMSFQGYFRDVRKHVIDWFIENTVSFSHEHASYIGEELALASVLKENYTQD